jgi:hypothetical protein
LCVHGTGHGDLDTTLVPSWTRAITENIHRWRPDAIVDLEFFRYDELFDHAPLNPRVYAEALARLLASGVVHGLEDVVTVGARGLFDIPDEIRWTAGMLAQWASEDPLRTELRTRLQAMIKAGAYTLVCGHSLGSLICYDTFRRNPGVLAAKSFVSCGSQIGNPFVRDAFAGRIEAIEGAKKWYNLFNRQDRALTARIRIDDPSFVEVNTDFDQPGNILNHDSILYFNHPNARMRVWGELAGAQTARTIARTARQIRGAAATPRRRALLVGLNDYPDPANRLEGCVNDVFLMSSVLQECGFAAEDIRVVLNGRATAANLLERFHWLLDGVTPGQERVLFYAGHGAQMPSYSVPGEVDHQDECLVPYDFDWTPEHAITDQQFVEFYSQLPYDSRFVAVFDCCHSGGMSRDGGLRPRGIEPPDDIRHRLLEWNAALGMWQNRRLLPAGTAVSRSKKGAEFVGASKDTFRFGRGVSLRGLPNMAYTDQRRSLRHLGPYLPVIMEACQEQELSYEYRDGAIAYGAFTYSLAKVLRERRAQQTEPTFTQLIRMTAARLKALDYSQNPCLVGPRKILRQPVPWITLGRNRGARRNR